MTIAKKQLNLRLTKLKVYSGINKFNQLFECYHLRCCFCTHFLFVVYFRISTKLTFSLQGDRNNSIILTLQLYQFRKLKVKGRFTSSSVTSIRLKMFNILKTKAFLNNGCEQMSAFEGVDCDYFYFIFHSQYLGFRSNKTI